MFFCQLHYTVTEIGSLSGRKSYCGVCCRLVGENLLSVRVFIDYSKMPRYNPEVFSSKPTKIRFTI